MMLVVVIRTTILYLILLFGIRLMGKRESGELQPFELVIAILIANLAATPMSDMGTPIAYGVIPIFTIIVIQTVIALFLIKYSKTRKVINGSPTVLIREGIIDESKLKEQKYTVSDLMEQLRLKDIFNVEDVEYAILETGGELSIMIKAIKQQVKKEDMNLLGVGPNLLLEAIVDGEFVAGNISTLNKSEEDILKILEECNTRLEDVLILMIDKDNNYNYQLKDGKRI